MKASERRDKEWRAQCDAWRKRDEEAEACVKELGQENAQLRRIIGKRAAGTDLLTEQLRTRADQAEADNKELQALFDLQHTRTGEATKLWQRTTGKTDVLPDLGALLSWLLARLKALEAELADLMDASEAFLATPPEDMKDHIPFSQYTTAACCRLLDAVYARIRARREKEEGK